MKESADDKPTIEECDLRAITRDSSTCLTLVTIHLDWETKSRWLMFGRASIHRNERQKTHRLEAHMPEGVTDFSHSSALAFRLPLIGLQLDDLVVYNHFTHFVAWVDPNGEDEFRVPSPGYDPTKLPDARTCKDRRCLEDEPKGHMMVPEGYYVPPFNAELFKKVRGKKIEISIGTKINGEDDGE